MNYTIILRHAERNKIRTINETEIASLTLNGIINSFIMGWVLKKKFNNICTIKTSYIKRCYDTACYIKWSYAPLKKIKVERAKNNGELVSSGYIKNENFWDWVNFHYGKKMDWKFFKEYYDEMINRNWAKYKSIDDYTNDFLKQNLTNKNTLIITHDTTLIPLLIGLKKIKKIDVFPKPLSGIIIHHEKGKVNKIEWIEKDNI